MPQKEVFSEQQVTEIIRRASELSEKGSQAESYTPGFTRAELEKMAIEIGVDPRCLEQAILESSEGAKRPGFRLSEDYERVVDGELDPDEFDLVTDFIKTAGRFGPGITQIGRSVRARAWAGPGRAEVDISSRNGRTKIRVRSHPVLGMIIGGYAAFLGVLLTTPALAEAGQYAASMGTAAAAVVAGGALGTILIRAGQKASKRLADQLRDRIEIQIGSKAEGNAPASEQTDIRQELKQS